MLNKDFNVEFHCHSRHMGGKAVDLAWSMCDVLMGYKWNGKWNTNVVLCILHSVKIYSMSYTLRWWWGEGGSQGLKSLQIGEVLSSEYSLATSLFQSTRHDLEYYKIYFKQKLIYVLLCPIISYVSWLISAYLKMFKWFSKEF